MRLYAIRSDGCAGQVACRANLEPSDLIGDGNAKDEDKVEREKAL